MLRPLSLRSTTLNSVWFLQGRCLLRPLKLALPAAALRFGSVGAQHAAAGTSTWQLRGDYREEVALGGLKAPAYCLAAAT